MPKLYPAHPCPVCGAVTQNMTCCSAPCLLIHNKREAQKRLRAARLQCSCCMLLKPAMEFTSYALCGL